MRVAEPAPHACAPSPPLAGESGRGGAACSVRVASPSPPAFALRATAGQALPALVRRSSKSEGGSGGGSAGTVPA
jgi:hypothetical protein